MKVGVIGCGGMGLHHAEVLRKLDMVDEVVCCDLGEAQRGKAQEKGLRALVTVEEVLAEKPGAVFVVTAPAAHAECIRKCLAKGVPVFTEKPLASTLAESRELVEAAEKKGIPFQVGFEMRYGGMVRGMREIVDSGAIGEPRHMSLVQISGLSAKAGYMTRERTGGIFYEKLCHQIDFYRYWFGEPERICAVAPPIVHRHYGIEDHVLSYLRFPGGRAGMITFITSRAANIGRGAEGDAKIDHEVRGHYYEMILTCSRGSVSYDAWTGTIEVIRYNHREDNKSELIDSIEVLPRWGEPAYALTEQNGDFLRRISAGKPPQFPASDALKSMEWVERAEESLRRGGEWISAEYEAGGSRRRGARKPSRPPGRSRRKGKG